MSTTRPHPHARTRPAERRATGQPSVFRWECRCQEPPQLLATYDAGGRVNIKVRDRYWHVFGLVQTICPRCGAEHLLDLRDRDRDRDREDDRGPRPAGGK